MSAIIYWQNPCKLSMIFSRIKAYMLAFSGSFSRKCQEGISFNCFVCFIFNVSIGSAPKRKNIDMLRNTRVGLGCQFTSNLLSCHLMLWSINIWYHTVNTIIAGDESRVHLSRQLYALNLLSLFALNLLDIVVWERQLCLYTLILTILIL